MTRQVHLIFKCPRQSYLKGLGFMGLAHKGAILGRGLSPLGPARE